MGIIGSKIFFIFIFIFSLIVMWLSVSKDKSFNKWTIIAALGLSSILGLRGIDVGIDTIAYYEFFEAFKQGFVVGVRGIDELGFVTVSYLIMKIFGSVQFEFFFWALVTNILILIRIHEVKDKISVPIATLTFFANFFFLEFNVLREMVAVAVIFYNSKYIFKQQYIKYMLGCFLAASFHWSAIIALILIPVSMINNLKRYKKYQILLVFIALLISIIGMIYLGVKYFELYGHYLQLGLKSSGIGLLIPLKILCFAFFILYEKTHKMKMKISRRVDFIASENWKYFIKICFVSYLIGLIGFLASYYIKYMDRAVFYFYVFEIICNGYWFRMSRKNNLLKLLLAIFILSPLMINFIFYSNGGQGQFPYYFYWHNRSSFF